MLSQSGMRVILHPLLDKWCLFKLSKQYMSMVQKTTDTLFVFTGINLNTCHDNQSKKSIVISIDPDSISLNKIQSIEKIKLQPDNQTTRDNRSKTHPSNA